MGKIGQARGFLLFRIVNKFFFRKRKKNKNGLRVWQSPVDYFIVLCNDCPDDQYWLLMEKTSLARGTNKD